MLKSIFLFVEFSDSSPLPKTRFYCICAVILFLSVGRRLVCRRCRYAITAARRGNTAQESFRPPFSKGGAIKPRRFGARRNGRNSLNGVFFCELFFCAYGIKRKVGDDFLCRYASIISSPVGTGASMQQVADGPMSQSHLYRTARLSSTIFTREVLLVLFFQEKNRKNRYKF